MLTPEYLQTIVDETESYVAGLNEYLTEKIAQRVINTFDALGEVKLIPSSILDIRKQENAGMLMSEIQKAVEQSLPEMKKKVRRAFKDAGAQIAEDLNDATIKAIQYEQAHGNMLDIIIPELAAASYAAKEKDLNMTDVEIAKLKSAYEATCGDAENFTRTAPTTANKAYLNACDKAYFKVMHGVSLNTAVVEAIEDLSRKGVEVISYGGRQERIEVAVARAVRTGVNRANGDITLTRAAESGAKYVIVSQHVGARVTPDEDYKNHSWWQGQVYSINWDDSVMSKYNVQEVPAGKMSFIVRMKDHMQEKKNKQYKDFVQTCGYGKMLGICGINCRHSFGLFWPGISVNNHKPIDTEENKKRYQDEQKQRAMERAIRKTKRSLNAVKKINTSDEELKQQLAEQKKSLKALLEKQSDTYMDFCNQKDLKPVHWRLQTARMRRSAAGEKNAMKMSVENSESKGYTKRTKKEFEQAAQQIREEITQYSERSSKWSGNIDIDNSLLDKGILGTKEWSCNITLVDTVDNGVVWHEMLHSCSGSYYGGEVYAENEYIEEATVEWLKQQICKEKNIINTYAYEDKTVVLQALNESFSFGTDMEFAKEIFNVPLPKRYQWLENRVDECLRQAGASFEDYNEVMRFVEKLKGGSNGRH